MSLEQIDIRTKRRDFAAQLGPKVKALLEAVKGYLQLRANGATRDEAQSALDADVRVFFPTKVSRFADPCDRCDGTGWEPLTCTHYQRCGRKRCGLSEPSWEHGYVVPCSCVEGDRHRGRVVQAEDAIAAAGRTQKPAKGWRQVGR